MATGRLLIVNADDYNTDPERNRGIIEAAKNGIVTSASVLTNTAGLDEALSALEQVLGPRIGVHLNLTRGKPLSPGVQVPDRAAGGLSAKGAFLAQSLVPGL